jgi:hypothetical protein
MQVLISRGDGSIPFGVPSGISHEKGFIARTSGSLAAAVVALLTIASLRGLVTVDQLVEGHREGRWADFQADACGDRTGATFDESNAATEHTIEYLRANQTFCPSR